MKPSHKNLNKFHFKNQGPPVFKKVSTGLHHYIWHTYHPFHLFTNEIYEYIYPLQSSVSFF